MKRAILQWKWTHNMGQKEENPQWTITVVNVSFPYESNWIQTVTYFALFICYFNLQCENLHATLLLRIRNALRYSVWVHFASIISGWFIRLFCWFGFCFFFCIFFRLLLLPSLCFALLSYSLWWFSLTQNELLVSLFVCHSFENTHFNILLVRSALICM